MNMIKIQRDNVEEVGQYLKNQSSYNHSTNIAINVDFMMSNLLK